MNAYDKGKREAMKDYKSYLNNDDGDGFYLLGKRVAGQYYKGFKALKDFHSGWMAAWDEVVAKEKALLYA